MTQIDHFINEGQAVETSQRVLVVCDEPVILDQLGKHLCEQNYDVRCASNAREALVFYKDWPAELVVSDYHLVDRHSLEMVEEKHTVR